MLQVAAIAEQHSEHPLGEAIVRKARERNLGLREYADLRYYPGKGLTCSDGAAEILVGTRTLLEERGLVLPAGIGGKSGRKENSSQTLVLVARDKTLLGTVTLADQLRPEAKQTIAELNRRGYDTVLLTGTPTRRRRPSVKSWASERLSEVSCQSRSWRKSVSFARVASKWRWWATA